MAQHVDTCVCLDCRFGVVQPPDPELMKLLAQPPRPQKRWIAVDFDGTLATFGCNWNENPYATGDPIPAMVELVKKWLADGEDVRIFTARMDCYHPKLGRLPTLKVKAPIEAWCLKHLGEVLPITNVKDYFCKALYDDRAIQVEKDTGRLIHD